MLGIFLFFMAGSGPIACAFETDQLTNRQVVILDSNEQISAYVTGMIQEAIDDTTRKIAKRPDHWTPADVAHVLRRQVSQENPFNYQHFGARIEVWLKKVLAPQGYGHVPAINGEIANLYMYREEMYGSVMDEGPGGGMSIASFILNLAEAMSGTVVAPTFVVGGARFGGDKLSHFFRLGYRYWKKSLKEDSPEEGVARAVRYGTRTEIGHLGFLTTGIFSYADLAANYAGFLFFSRLAAPAAECGNGCHLAVRDDLSIAWNTPFLASDYVTVDWDEWLNRSIYNSGVSRAVRRYLGDYHENLCAEYAEWKPQFEIDQFELMDRSIYVDPRHEPSWVAEDPTLDLGQVCAGTV